nr:hypothetical protein [Lachnospiraceae bacterium]
VLDQKSIDKLIELIGKTSSLTGGVKPVIVTDAATGAEVALDGAVVSMEKDAKGFVLIFVVKDGKKYSVAPESLVERKYVAVGSPWGLAISPRMFAETAKIFGVEFDKASMKTITKDFARIVYGSEDAKIPSFYLG